MSSIFLLFGSQSLVLCFHVWVKLNFSDNSNIPVLVNIQRLRENGNRILRVPNGDKWFSVRLRTKWLFNQFPMQLLKFQLLKL